jgi:regulation of enolase protein 1 (concanavalin A-like superfamily)
VIGSGDDIWNSADELQFASRSLAGNGEIVARVNSQESTDGWAKAGVMIRETLTAGSRQAMMVLSPDNGSQFGYRTATNGASGWTGADAVKVKAPYWVKLVRNADVITGYISADGTTWTSRGSITLGGLAANVFVGLANCSGNDGLLNTTKFDNVTVTQATPQPKVSLVLLENGATQRSMIHNLSVRFDQQVTLATDAISLTRNGVAVPFTLSPGSGSSLIFALNFGTGGLGDGTYTLTVNAAGVTGAGGTMASNYTYSFYRLYGDVDADRAVTFNDFLVLQNAFGSTSGSASYNAGLDVEDNGVNDFNDFLALQNNFGKTI